MRRVRSVLARHDLSALARLRTRSLSRVASLTQCVSCPILIVRCLLSVSCGCAGVPTNDRSDNEVLRTADAENMSELMPPLCRDDGYVFGACAARVAAVPLLLTHRNNFATLPLNLHPIALTDCMPAVECAIVAGDLRQGQAHGHGRPSEAIKEQLGLYR